MADVFRILDRFRITGRGPVYAFKHDDRHIIRMDDIFYDLQGNRFKVKGFAHNRPHGDYGELIILLLFEMMDGIEAEGNILLRSLDDISFIFCNHLLYPKRVDEDYEEEYQAAGLEHACALFSYEDLETGKLSLYGEEISGLTIYRGWMMKPEMYRTFYEKLEERGIILINTPEEYEKYHMLPGWYDDFKEFTAKSVWEDQGAVETALSLTKGLEGSYIVKDYVKSRKHEWYDACFIEDITDKKSAERIIGNFIDRQESDLVGGVVLRKFERLKSIGFHEKSGMPLSEEYRVFIFAGRIMIVDDYWQEGKKISFSEDERLWIEEAVKKVKSNFVTMDLARREDGSLIIMELGDGQVSGIQQIKPADFYKAFNPEVIRLGDVPGEEAFPDGTVILAGDPLPYMEVEEMRQMLSSITTTQELVDVYVKIHNKYWFIADDFYDCNENTEEHKSVQATVEAWGEIMEQVDKQIMDTAEKEGLLAERQSDSGTVKQLEGFMKKYGYRNGRGWWVKSS